MKKILLPLLTFLFVACASKPYAEPNDSSASPSFMDQAGLKDLREASRQGICFLDEASTKPYVEDGDNGINAKDLAGLLKVVQEKTVVTQIKVANLKLQKNLDFFA